MSTLFPLFHLDNFLAVLASNPGTEEFAAKMLLVLPPAICLLWVALKLRRTVMSMRFIPTSKVDGVYIGLAEVKGAAHRDDLLVSPLAGVKCVWYRYSVEEKWLHTDQRTRTDSDGKLQVEDVTEQGWTTLREGCSAEAFELVDDTGAVRVLPEGATVEAEEVMYSTCDKRSPMYFGKCQKHEIKHTTHIRRFTEHVIRPDACLYLLGTARLGQDAVRSEFARCDTEDPYLISVRSAQRITSSKSLLAAILPLVGAAVLLLPTFWEGCDFPKNIYNPDCDFPHQSHWLHAAVIYMVCWAFLVFVQWYKATVNARNRVTIGAALVAGQQQWRRDLIGQLVEAAEARCRQEPGLQEHLAGLCGQIASGQMGVLSQACPALKADPRFSRLQQEFAATEERLSRAREYCNTLGNFYNAYLRVFPAGLLLRLMGFRTFREEE